MVKMPPRKIVVTAALLALLLAGAAVWWLTRITRPAPTAFGWPADLLTVAGNGVRGHSDGSTTQATFSDPFAIAIDKAGALYVADAGDPGRIRKIAPDGSVTTLSPKLDTPSGLAMDRQGNLFVAETGGNRIRRIAVSGEVTTMAGDGTPGFRDGPAGQARFDGPIGVAVDKDGNVYVADSYNDRIRRITSDGQVTTLAGGSAPGFADGQGSAAAFDTPCGVAVDRDGALLIADTGNDAIRRLDRHGRVTTLARTIPGDRTSALHAPIGLAPTWDGYLYIASFHHGAILQLAPSGALHTLTGPGASPAGNAALRLASPAGIALDASGALFVADPAKYAIRKLVRRPRGAAATIREIETAPPALTRAATVPWPVRPQTAWHEIVGDMGEVRGNYEGESRDHIHAGLDIHGEIDQPGLAVADETVESPLPNWGLDTLSEGLRIDAMTYIHLRVGRTASGAPIDPARFRLLRDAAGHVTAVRVKRGTRFHVGDPLGTMNSMAHVHLELGVPGGQINPMALRLPGFADHVAPHIDGVYLLDGAGQRLGERHAGRLVVRRDSGLLTIVADAWDRVDGDAPRRRLGLYKAGFQVLHADGTPVPGFGQPRVTLEFDRVPASPDAAKIAYAPASGDAVHSDQPTRMLYAVSNAVRGGRSRAVGWSPAALAPGDYTLRIFAADRAGNVALANRDLAITIR